MLLGEGEITDEMHLRGLHITGRSLAGRIQQGEYVRIDLESAVATSVLPPGVLVASAADDHGEPWLLTVEDISRNAFLLTSPHGKPDLDGIENWLVSPPLRLHEEEQAYAVAVSGDRAFVLTDRRLASIRAVDKSWKTTGILPRLDFLDASRHVAIVLQHRFWLGVDIGEWGGALVSVDIGNGSARRWLSANVNAIIGDPKDARCVLASSGLTHLFETSGEIVRICGNRNQTLYQGEVPVWGLVTDHQDVKALVDAGLAPVAGGDLKLSEVTAIESPSTTLAGNPATVSNGMLLYYSGARWEVSTSGLTPYIVRLPEGVDVRLTPMPRKRTKTKEPTQRD